MHFADGIRYEPPVLAARQCLAHHDPRRGVTRQGRGAAARLLSTADRLSGRRGAPAHQLGPIGRVPARQSENRCLGGVVDPAGRGRRGRCRGRDLEPGAVRDRQPNAGAAHPGKTVPVDLKTD